MKEKSFYKKERENMKRLAMIFAGSILCLGAICAQAAFRGDFPPPPDKDKGGMEKEFDAVVKVESGSKSIKNESINSDQDGKNAIFASNGASVDVSNVKIHTKKNDSRGLYVAFGGIITARKVEVSTEGEHCAAFATDMGEGKVTVEKGSALTKGQGSPVIYSTGEISVKNIEGTAENSELAVIEGKNSVSIENSNLTGGSGLADEVKSGVMLYQSMSGDANSGKAIFSSKKSTLTNKAEGPFFYVTNTLAQVNLENTELKGKSDILIMAAGNNSSRGWGQSGKNGGQLEFNALSQKLSGEIIVDKISSLKLNLGKKSLYTGVVNAKKEGRVDINIEKTAKVIITGDSYFDTFVDEDTSYKNITSQGHIIYYNVNNKANKSLGKKTILLSDGGKIVPTEYDFAEISLDSSNGSKMKMPDRKNDGKSFAADGKRASMDFPKIEMAKLTGTLNIISDKAMLIDDDNKATLLSLRDSPEGKGPQGGRPPMGKMDMKMGNPPDMGTGGNQPPAMPEQMSSTDNNPPSKKERPKTVTFADLKKLKGKKVEISGALNKDGSFTVFTVTEKK